jgi:hypothetical protein
MVTIQADLRVLGLRIKEKNDKLFVIEVRK